MDKEFIDIYNIISNEPYNEKNENKFNKERQINKETKIDKAWKYYYNLAKKYYEFHGNLEIRRNFRTKNGYEYDETGVKLGSWISAQRTAYKGESDKKLTAEQISLLKKIDMIFDIYKYNWMKNYNLAASYYEHYGNLEIPFKFKTKNGYEYDDKGVSLGFWINNQRTAYKGKSLYKISDEQVSLLEKIDMIFENKRNMEWMRNYNLAASYYKHHGNLEIPQRFKTTNGYEYDSKGINLGRWINIQRQAYKNQGTYKISKDQIILLDKIKMNFDAHSNNWMKNYNLAKKYYEHHGNLEIPFKFKTKNGYESDEQGISLGIWINNQKNAYKGQGTSKLIKNQIELLEEIKIVWFSEDVNQKLQNQIISEKNKKKKQIEMLNRLKSYLNTLDENKIYSKEEINVGFVKKLSK